MDRVARIPEPTIKGTKSVNGQLAVLNLASGTVVNCRFLCWSVGCYNHI